MLSAKPALESHLVKHWPLPHSDRVIPFAECHHPLSATSSGALSKIKTGKVHSGNAALSSVSRHCIIRWAGNKYEAAEGKYQHKHTQGDMCMNKAPRARWLKEGNMHQLWLYLTLCRCSSHHLIVYSSCRGASKRRAKLLGWAFTPCCVRVSLYAFMAAEICKGLSWLRLLSMLYLSCDTATGA